MKLAVVGVTGTVGKMILKVLEERKFPISTLIPVASEKSVGKTVVFNQKEYKIVTMEDAIAQQPTIALFSAAPELACIGSLIRFL